MTYKVLQTIWTSLGREHLVQVTRADGTVIAPRWYVEHGGYHRLITYGEYQE